MEKVLITGGAGYLGSVLSELLLKNDFEVYIIDNLLYNQSSILHLFKYEKFHFIHDDVRNVAVLNTYVDLVDIIIPLAAIVGMPACRKNPELTIEVNFNQIRNIIKRIGTKKKIILPNTNSQYGSSTEIITEDSPFNPLSLYAKTKCDAESELLDSGNGVSLRLATVFGVSPRMRLDLLVNDFTFRAFNDKFLVLFEANFKRNYIHVQDIAETFLFMINNYDKCSGDVFNVGLSKANLSKLELALKIKEFIPELIILEEEFKKDPDQRNYIVSNEKLENLGWKPKYDLDYGIDQLLRSYSLIQKVQNRNFTNL